MLLSQKRKAFSRSFTACLESTQISVHFKKKDQQHRLNILY